MTAARLEELVYRCNEAIEDTSNGFGAYFDAQDIADLARCARAWAKVAKGLEATRDVTLHGVDVGALPRWTWWPDDDSPSRATTAIEAVEAAEGTDANEG